MLPGELLLGIVLGLVPRTALGTSLVRGEVAVVDVTDFSLSLDVWLVHRRQPGNLRKALEALAVTVSSRMEWSPS